MKCKQCKKEIPDGAKRCPECHSDLRNWFVRHKILTGILILFLLGLILSSLDSSNSTTKIIENEQGEQIEVPKEWQTIKTFNGKGNKDTESFTINTSKVKITATTASGTFGTFSSIELESDEGKYLYNPGLNISTKGSEKGNGETTYRNLEPGEYYISVISGVNWEVEVEEYK